MYGKDESVQIVLWIKRSYKYRSLILHVGYLDGILISLPYSRDIIVHTIIILSNFDFRFGIKEIEYNDY